MCIRDRIWIVSKQSVASAYAIQMSLKAFDCQMQCFKTDSEFKLTTAKLQQGGVQLSPSSVLSITETKQWKYYFVTFHTY